MKVPRIDYGVAGSVLPGQGESGDRHLICFTPHGVLMAVLDGIGHGEEAAKAARSAVSILKSHSEDPIIQLVDECHERLRMTRGVTLSLAFVHSSREVMSWIGIGKIQGVLLHPSNGRQKLRQELLLLRGGVVGSRLPPLRVAELPVAVGDTLAFATDGVGKRANLLVRVKANISKRLSRPVETTLYRVVQEALTNAAKHSRAKMVSITATQQRNEIRCSVEDDGVGFDASAATTARGQGLDIIGMRERLNAIGGSLTIHSSPGQGTKLVFRIAGRREPIQ